MALATSPAGKRSASDAVSSATDMGPSSSALSASHEGASTWKTPALGTM